MKFSIALALALSAVSSQAAVTLGFSTGTNIAEGFTNSAGSATATMVWGIIVDTQGDGFDGFVSASSVASDGGSLITAGATYEGGFQAVGTSGAGSLPTGQLLSVGGQVTDDRLFLSVNLMALVGGDVRLTQLSGFTYDSNMAAGDKYAIVWFDTTSMGGTIANGVKYGAWFKDGASVSTGTVLPSDPGTYTTTSGGSAGPVAMFGGDETASAKSASLSLVPEPSSMLLGLLGGLGLLRRRR